MKLPAFRWAGLKRQFIVSGTMAQARACNSIRASARQLVEPSPAQDHWLALLRPRFPGFRLFCFGDVEDVGLPLARRERNECRVENRVAIQPALQLLRDWVL